MQFGCRQESLGEKRETEPEPDSDSSKQAMSSVLLLLFMAMASLRGSEASTEQRKIDYRALALSNYQAPAVRFTRLFCNKTEGKTWEVMRCSSLAQTTAQDSNPLPDRDVTFPVWLFEDQPLPTGSLERAYARITSPDITVGDMDLTQLVRMVYLADDDLRDEIVSKLQAFYDAGDLRFWLQAGEQYSTYWTENHAIMWLSCTWLLKPYISFREDDDAILGLDRRLNHFLDTKMEYGMYEFFSAVYYKFTLGALLNIIDFTSDVDAEVREKAYDVFSRTLNEVLLLTTSEGYYYPPAARGKQNYYNSSPYLDMVWFLTGNGRQPNKADFFGAFLSTSSVDLESIASTWTESASKQFMMGHSVDELKNVHSSLPRADRTLFQWSAGVYADSRYVTDSRYAIKTYALYNHNILPGFLAMIVRWTFDPILWLVTTLLRGQANGTNIAGALVTIFKDNGVVLSSLEDFNVGYRGGEQWPWVATVGDIAVFTQAGITGRSFESNLAINSHLPNVKQAENVALISYKPTVDVYLPALFLNLFGVDEYNTKVSLFFPIERFDETAEVDRWLLGRKGNNYVAVWRHSLDKTTCSESDNGCTEYYFSDPKWNGRRQSWVAVVGTDNTHGSFENFARVIRQGVVTQDIPNAVSQLFGQSHYFSVDVDGKQLSIST